MSNKFNVSKFHKEVLLQKVLGPILDMARVSSMGDRQFTQYQRSVKNMIYEVIESSNSVLCAHEVDGFETTKDILQEERAKEVR